MTATRGVLIALLGFALFSVHDALIKEIGQRHAVTTIIFFAGLFAFPPISLLILVDREQANFLPRRPMLVFARSAFQIGAMLGAFYAFTALPLAEAYALLFAMPLFVTALSAPLLGETVRAQRWAAVLVGLVGVLIVLRPGVTEVTLGHLAAIGSAVCIAFAVILGRKIGSTERFAVMLLYPMLLSLVVMAALLPVFYQPVALSDLARMAGVGVVQVIAQVLLLIAVRATPAALFAPTQYSQIIWATLFGAVFFNEQPDLFVFLGSLVVILSGVFIIWRESRADVSAQNPVLRISNPRPYSGGQAPATFPEQNRSDAATRPGEGA